MCYFCPGLEERLWRVRAFGTCARRAVCWHPASAGDGEGRQRFPFPLALSKWAVAFSIMYMTIIQQKHGNLPHPNHSSWKEGSISLPISFPPLELTLPTLHSKWVPAAFASPTITFQKLTKLPASLQYLICSQFIGKWENPSSEPEFVLSIARLDWGGGGTVVIVAAVRPARQSPAPAHGSVAGNEAPGRAGAAWHHSPASSGASLQVTDGRR